ncbi:MAG: sigma-70 family RNA polymerase sigma factor [Deltaproteobacteria bacterium]|nr:sigma-70 family RNA polymerase sigma factor [Kofleriaceae bacterium]
MAESEDQAAAARAAREHGVRELLTGGKAADAAAQAIELYGGEVLGFLHAVARDDDLAAEAFSVFSEDLLRGLPTFRWDASLRTWCYALARNALHRLRRDPRRRARNNVSLSNQAAGISAIVEQVRTATLPFLRTEVKDELRRLRESLDPDDHALIVLRIDRKMSWKDIARALPGDDGQELERRAATLRKRFERAKTMLREMATARGLITGD